MQRRRVKIVRPENATPDPSWGPQAVLPAGMGEADLQATCETVATRYGWTVYHETDSRKSPKGLPDLVMLSPDLPDGSVLLAMLELKAAKGVATAEQAAWLEKLSRVSTLATGLVRPADWPEFLALCFDPEGLRRATDSEEAAG